MDFLEILSENWVEILGAVGTIVAVFFGTKRKRTPEEKHAAEVAKQEKKTAKAATKAKKEADKLVTLKGEN